MSIVVRKPPCVEPNPLIYHSHTNPQSSTSPPLVQVQSVMQRLAEKFGNGAIKIHSRFDTLPGARNSKGFGLLWDAKDTPIFLEALSETEQLLEAKMVMPPVEQFSPSSASSASPPASPGTLVLKE